MKTLLSKSTTSYANTMQNHWQWCCNFGWCKKQQQSINLIVLHQLFIYSYNNQHVHWQATPFIHCHVISFNVHDDTLTTAQWQTNKKSTVCGSLKPTLQQGLFKTTVTTRKYLKVSIVTMDWLYAGCGWLLS